jgi:hypothetical protein
MRPYQISELQVTDPPNDPEDVTAMPLTDAYVPSDSLSPAAEAELVERLTDLLLLEHEGVDRNNATGRQLAWVFVHRPDVYVGGPRPRSPRYRFICLVPEGQYSDERRASVTGATTTGVTKAEDGASPHPERRIVTFPRQRTAGVFVAAGERARAGART